MSKMTTLPVDLRLQSYRNLLEVASQDQSVTGSESKVLDRIARRWGLTEEDASRASLLPANGKAEQSDPLIRFDELCELVELALADNVLDEYPDESIYANSTFGLMPYSLYSPFGFNGRYLYGRVAYKW